MRRHESVLSYGRLLALCGIMAVGLAFPATAQPVPETAAKDALPPITIAIIDQLTGLGANIPQSVGMGANLALEEINQSGGILGRPLDILFLDNASTPIGANAAALHAIDADVVGVVGPNRSSLALSSAPALQAAGIPVVINAATNTKVTGIGDYIFRVCFADDLQGKVLAKFARDDLGAQTAIMLVNASEDYSLGLAEVFRAQFTQRGGHILWEGFYRKETLDFQDLLQRVAELQPDVTFVPGYVSDSALIAQQAVKLGVRTTYLGGDAWPQITITPDVAQAVEGAYFTSHWHADVDTPQSRHLKTLFRDRYGEDLVMFAPVLAYDAVMVLADAIQRAGSTDPQKIRDALAATRDFEAASGTITLDEHRNPRDKETVILTFKNGQITFVKSVKP